MADRFAKLRAVADRHGARLSDIFVRFGESLFLQLALLTLFSSLTLLLGGHLGAWMWPVAMAGGCLYLYLTTRSLRSVGLFFLLMLTAVAVCAYLWDFMYDSSAYHEEGVLMLAQGWNPYHEPGGEATIWTAHYAKLMETMQSCVFLVTDNLESSKAINFVLYGAMAGYAWGALDFVRGRRRRVLVLLAVVLNPVVLAQLFTFYIDYCFYCYLVIMLAMMRRLVKKPGDAMAYLQLAMAVIMCGGTKFNAFFMAGLTGLCWIVWLLLTRRFRTAWISAGVFSVAALLCFGVFFYHPYVTNILTAGNPVYPLLGEGAEDIMSSNTPDLYYVFDNRFINFFISIYGFYADASSVFPWASTRIGGFGFLMCIMLPVAIYLAVKRRSPMTRTAVYVLVCAVASCFVFEQSWWARYNTQLWLIVPLATLYISMRWAKWLLAAFIMIGIMGWRVPYYNWRRSCLLKSQIEEFRQTGIVVNREDVVLRHKLPRWNVPYRVDWQMDTTASISIDGAESFVLPDTLPRR